MIRRMLRNMEFEFVRYPYKLRQGKIDDRWKDNRIKLFISGNVDLILDVGANVGQYGRDLKASRYANRVISYSFEPLPLTDVFTAFLTLVKYPWQGRKRRQSAEPS